MIQPFSGFLNFEESIKENWTLKLGEPPFGHAELSKLKVFCKKTNIDLKHAKTKLDEKGIKYSVEDTLKTIARNNNISPNEIYNIIKPEKKSLENKDDEIPTSLGRKTLKDLENMGKIELANSLNLLSAKGAVGITEDTRIKEIANELDLMPIDVYNLIKK